MVNETHHQFVIDNHLKMTAYAMQKALMKKGLSTSQSNDCVRNQRIKLGEYKSDIFNSNYNKLRVEPKPGKWRFKNTKPLVEKKNKSKMFQPIKPKSRKQMESD